MRRGRPDEVHVPNLKTSKVYRYFPAYVERMGAPPITADVTILEDIFEVPWVKAWTEHEIEGRKFVGWRRGDGRDDMLMALYGEDESSWHVVAFVEDSSLLTSLPIWHISPEGQRKVDEWNAQARIYGKWRTP
jgi:hypothetical protein